MKREREKKEGNQSHHHFLAGELPIESILALIFWTWLKCDHIVHFFALVV